jgi:hypothetical protein
VATILQVSQKKSNYSNVLKVSKKNMVDCCLVWLQPLVNNKPTSNMTNLSISKESLEQNWVSPSSSNSMPEYPVSQRVKPTCKGLQPILIGFRIRSGLVFPPTYALKGLVLSLQDKVFNSHLLFSNFRWLPIALVPTCNNG